jgi:hypothetical protein
MTATDDDLLAELQVIAVLLTATNAKLTTMLKIMGVS